MGRQPTSQTTRAVSFVRIRTVDVPSGAGGFFTYRASESDPLSGRPFVPLTNGVHAMSVAGQTTFGFFGSVRDARAYHESKTSCEHVLRLLRKASITKVGWERNRPGARIAPAIEVLRNGYGFGIGGDGSQRNPYFLLDRGQWPTKVRTSPAMESAYYETDHWKETRQRRYEHDGYRCVVCIGHNDCDLQCHHLVYNLFAEKLEELITVCEQHHELIHENSRIGFPIGVPLPIADRLVGYHEFEEWLKP